MKGIYKITNIYNNKCYIGESMNIERRWKEHKKSLQENKHHSYKLQKDYNQYGENAFIYEIILEADSRLGSSLQQLTLKVYEDKFITQYDSIDNGYNVEYTLFKMLIGEKGIFSETINKKHIDMLKKVFKNISSNNGIYVPSEEYLMQREINIQKSQEKSEFKKVKEKKSKKEIKEKVIIKEPQYININVDKITFHECIEYFKYIGYKFNCTYGEIFSKLRYYNILYFDENKNNIPNDIYLNKYFDLSYITNNENKTFSRIWVLQEGIDFLKRILVEYNLMIIKQIGT
jgi:group I intron endonuclease